MDEGASKAVRGAAGRQGTESRVSRAMRKGGAAILAATAGIGVLVSWSAARAAEPEQADRVRSAAAPAVVRVVCGWEASWSWSGRTVRRTHADVGAGFFVHPDGWIVTSAHVVVSAKETEPRLRAAAGFDLLYAFLESSGNPTDEQHLRNLMAHIRAGQIPEPKLAEFRRVAFVELQDGRRMPFEVKAIRVPFGSEPPQVYTGQDLAVLKVDGKGMPSLSFGDSGAVKPESPLWILGFPAFEADAGEERRGPPASVLKADPAGVRTSLDGVRVMDVSAPPLPGGSGGPVLLGGDGRVVGVFTLPGRTLDGREVVAPGFVIPIEAAAALLREVGVTPAAAAAAPPAVPGTSVGAAPLESRPPASADAKTDRVATKKEAAEIFGFPLWVVIAAGGGVLLLLVVLVYAMVRRDRRGQASGPAASVQSGQSSAAAAAAAQPWPPPVPPVVSPVAKTVLAPAPATTARLVCTAGPLRGREFPIGPGLTLGRDPSRVQLVIQDPQVSALHAWVGPVGDRIVVRDLGSSNGTFVDLHFDQRVTEMPLHDGAVITLGTRRSNEFTFRA